MAATNGWKICERSEFRDQRSLAAAQFGEVSSHWATSGVRPLPRFYRYLIANLALWAVTYTLLTTLIVMIQPMPHPVDSAIRRAVVMLSAAGFCVGVGLVLDAGSRLRLPLKLGLAALCAVSGPCTMARSITWRSTSSGLVGARSPGG
ncbi:hypothetical protein LRS10_19610 [Phenylobacterium sp. J426]|uniref:hypothetical protein n=1 Tax=Phenylobacterium sp. J426 TaxID=2898439 RepID=UPI002151E410|nr:hypothetical protein [Phenylobacterium sp. J426]MCR5876157.1 hypothetical protein [Phenylobacterium sp. J426]